MQLKQPRWFKLFFTGLVHHLIRVTLLGCSLTHFTERNPGVYTDHSAAGVMVV